MLPSDRVVGRNESSFQRGSRWILTQHQPDGCGTGRIGVDVRDSATSRRDDPIDKAVERLDMRFVPARQPPRSLTRVGQRCVVLNHLGQFVSTRPRRGSAGAIAPRLVRIT